MGYLNDGDEDAECLVERYLLGYFVTDRPGGNESKLLLTTAKKMDLTSRSVLWPRVLGL